MGPHEMGLDICSRFRMIQPRQYIFNFSQRFPNIPIVFPLLMFFRLRGDDSFPYIMESEISSKSDWDRETRRMACIAPSSTKCPDN